MLPKVFCFWLLTRKQQLIHSFLTGVIVIFSRVLGPIHQVPHSGALTQLILVSEVFLATKDFYDISRFFVMLFALQTSLEWVQGLSLIVTTQFYDVKRKWHNRRHLFLYVSGTPNSTSIQKIQKEIFVSGHQTQKILLITSTTLIFKALLIVKI